jgi:hypothetical protein
VQLDAQVVQRLRVLVAQEQADAAVSVTELALSSYLQVLILVQQPCRGARRGA